MKCILPNLSTCALSSTLTQSLVCIALKCNLSVCLQYLGSYLGTLNCTTGNFAKIISNQSKLISVAAICRKQIGGAMGQRQVRVFTVREHEKSFDDFIISS